jgi:murein DD-endopeptidase MepM/ murein hydrolase activator NlpD
MAIVIDINNIETKTLQKILEACEKSFPKELSLEEFYGEGQTTWSIPEIGIVYKNTTSKKDLLNFVETLTDTKNIRQAYANIYEEVESRKITPKEAPRPEEKTKTTLNKDESTNLQEKAVARETKRKEIIEKSNKEVREAIKKKQELYKQKVEDQKIKDVKKIVVIPTEKIHTVTLTEKEKEELYNLKQAVNKDPATVKKIFEERITQSISKASDPQIKTVVTPEIISKTAFSITENISAFPDYKSVSEIPTVIPVMNPVSPLVAISDINDEKLKKLIPNYETLKDFISSSQTLAIALDTERSVNVAGANAVLNSENITSVFYGDNSITQFQVSENQEEKREEGIEIDPKEIYKQGKELKDIWGKLINRTATVEEVSVPTSAFVTPYLPASNATLAVKSSSLVSKALPAIDAVYGYKQGILLSQWTRNGIPLLMNPQIAGMLTSGSMQMTIASSELIMSAPTQFVVGKFAIGFTTGVTAQGQQVAYAGVSFGQKFAGLMGVKGGTQVAVGTVTSQAGAKLAVGASSFLTKALTFFGGLGSWATAGISLVAGWILGKIIEKIDWKKFKENVLPVIAIGGGLLVGGPIGLTMIAGGGLYAIGALKGVGVGAFFGRLGAIFGSIAVTIATPIIVTLLVIPPTVAFFMFIINSGAYMVPPSALTFANIINPYIEVTKTPVPPGPFENSELPLTVEYKITIKAKKDVLKNIRLTYECGVVKTGPKINCPQTSPNVPTTLEDIQPGETFSFSYKQEYSKGNFEDSLIVDTITVTADTAGQSGVKSSASAGVKIGNPPDDCPSIWPVDSGKITQTPDGGYSHIGVEAIDVSLPTGTKVKATHSGIATTYEGSGGYGNHVIITSSCGGKIITTTYAHLLGFSIPNGKEVLLGQMIGASGDTGNSTGPHLHYEFKGGLQMVPPFIPKAIIRGCSNDGIGCGFIP